LNYSKFIFIKAFISSPLLFYSEDSILEKELVQEGWTKDTNLDSNSEDKIDKEAISIKIIWAFCFISINLALILL